MNVMHDMMKRINYQEHGRPQGGRKTGIFPPEIGHKNQNFPENMKSAAQFRLIGLILAITIYLAGRHSHCTRVRFAILVSYSSELAVHLCLLHCVVQLGADSSAVGFYWVTECDQSSSVPE